MIMLAVAVLINSDVDLATFEHDTQIRAPLKAVLTIAHKNIMRSPMDIRQF